MIKDKNIELQEEIDISKRIDNLNLIKIIGRGTFGIVYKAYQKLILAST